MYCVSVERNAQYQVEKIKNCLSNLPKENWENELFTLNLILSLFLLQPSIFSTKFFTKL